MKTGFKFLKHTADVKFQAFGKNLEEAFTNAAYALKKTIADIKVKPIIRKKIEVEGKDKENLLYNFLEEFLFLLDAESFLLANIKEIKINKTNFLKNKFDQKKDDKYKLEADIIGDKASAYKFVNDVKAITYNEMFVKKQNNKFICQVVVDV